MCIRDSIGKLDPHDICIKSRYYTPQLGLKLNCFALYLQKFISDQKVYPIFEVPMVEMFNSIAFLCVMLYACLSESTKVCNHIGSIVYIIVASMSNSCSAEFFFNILEFKNLQKKKLLKHGESTANVFW